MKKKLIIIFFCIVNMFAQENRNLNVGIISSSEFFLGYKSAKESVKNWMIKIAEKNNIPMKITFYENDQDEFQDYLSGKLNVGFFETFFVLDNEKEFLKTSNDFWTISFSKEDKNHYCLIANSNVNFKSFKDLKGEKISILRSNDMGTIWLDMETLKANGMMSTELVDEMIYENKGSTVLLNVYFNKTTLGIIREDTYKTMLELNPAISKKVKLFKCTKNSIPIFISVIKKGTNAKSKKTFLDIMTKKTVNDDSEEFFTILPLDHFYRLSKKDIKVVKDFLSEYRALKKRYAKE